MYLFGHSLGGNLVEHIMIDNSQSIENAFVINLEHISQELLDTQDKVNTFNNSKKFSCYVIGGDWVSDLKKFKLFQYNINYIKNNNSLKHNILSEHAVESASINKLGEFETISREEAFKWHEHKFQRLVTYVMAITEKIVKIMYESTSAMFNKVFSKDDEIKALPKATHNEIKQDNIREGYKLENFKTTDQNLLLKSIKHYIQVALMKMIIK